MRRVLLLAALVALCAAACRSARPSADGEARAAHPRLLHTEADFAFVGGKIAAGERPWTNAYAHLCASRFAQPSWRPHAVRRIGRLDSQRWSALYPKEFGNYLWFAQDSAAAYQLALRWKLSGDARFAKAAIAVCDAWARTCEGFLVDGEGELLDPNEYLISIQTHQIVNAAEILRASPDWPAADFAAFRDWTVRVLYPPASRFLRGHGDHTSHPLHYWLNWDLAQMTAVLSIGVLADDPAKVDEAITYFRAGVGAGNITNAVPFLHRDPDSGEVLGQCMESGRDQAHSVLCVGLMGAFCRMAENAGRDVFAARDFRALAMCEYVAKYNLFEPGPDGVKRFVYDAAAFPYTSYSNDSGVSCPEISFIEHRDGNDFRGTVRPVWELVCRLAADHGRPARYARAWAELMRRNGARGSGDGGGGDFGESSGGFDQLGYGTLMFAR